MNRYKVTWHTRPGIGATYYRSVITVYAENDDDSIERARAEVALGFREYPLDHIVIETVERIA